MFFDLSWSHILLVLIVALVVVGPKDLPKMMRMVGQWMGKARAMANQLRKSFDEMARQSELDELREEINALRQRPPACRHRTIAASIDPAAGRSGAACRKSFPQMLPRRRRSAGAHDGHAA